MQWQEEFKQKTITAQQAAALIKSGDRIATGNREARAILNAILDRTDLENVYYYAPIPNYKRDTELLGKGFRPAYSFLNDTAFEFREQGRLDFIPGEYWTYNKIAKTLDCNVALILVSPPDEHGYMSLSTSADSIRRTLEDADLVIAEVNETFPFIYGTNTIHISQIDYVVAEGSNYLQAETPVDRDEEHSAVYKAIGGYLSDLIPDEATLEVGLGRLNTASMMYMENKKNLGVHTEVYGDLLMILTEKGMITNEKKSMKKGKAVFTQMVGTRELFNWSHKNLGLEIDRCEEVVNPGIICAQHRMTAINNAVEVDLLGQANAEYVKGVQYSGMGGINNFAAGAAASLEGKSIIVLESTTRNGKFSKIVPFFKPGTPVSLPRTSVEYVVTEQGVATLVGKTPEARCRELIAVAHPKFREELTAKAKEIGILV